MLELLAPIGLLWRSNITAILLISSVTYIIYKVFVYPVLFSSLRRLPKPDVIQMIPIREGKDLTNYSNPIQSRVFWKSQALFNWSNGPKAFQMMVSLYTVRFWVGNV